MAHARKPRFWRLCRIYFRRFRIAVWLLVLFVLGTLAYLNQVGLPGFVKEPVLEKLRARGLDLQFSRLRLRFYQGIVAEHVRFGQADEPLSPHLTLAEVQVRLNFRALTRLQLQVDSVNLHQGRLLVPLAATNQVPAELAVNGIESELRFLPNDQWELDNFKAEFAGARIRLVGVITNASALREARLFPGARTASVPASRWQTRLRRLAETLDRIHFSAPPELSLDVRGDARDLQSFSVLMLVSAEGAQTPWGAVSQGRFSGRVFPALTNASPHGELNLEAAAADTPWGGITNFLLHIRLATLEAQTNLVAGQLKLSAAQLQTPWGGGSNALLTADWTHALTNPIPVSGRGRFECDFAQTQWGSAERLRFEAALTLRPGGDGAPNPDSSWGWWTNLQPYAFVWDCQVAELRSPKLQASDLSCGGNWAAPGLAVTNLQAKLCGGQLQADGHLDVVTRAVELRLASDLEPHQLGPLLTEGGRRWLADFSWERPPRLKAELALVLPAWTNRQPDWRTDVQPALRLAGEFNLERGAAYRQIQFSTARSHFSYSNLCWDLPDLTLTRPEGGIAAVHHADERTKDYYWHIDSTVDPRLVRPLLQPNEQRAFDLVGFTQPPVLEAELWGRFHDYERLGGRARVALTNFTFRGQRAGGLQALVQYTNGCLQVFAPQIDCGGTQHVSADGLLADFKAQLVYLTNGLSTADPMLIARAIGPHIGRAIEPYHFSRPPTARVIGIIPMRGEEGADLQFDLAGGPFHWWKLHVPHLSGHVHWLGQRLTLSDVRADFYQGQAAGAARFNFEEKPGTGFSFNLAVTNTLLQALMADLSPHTNHLEGLLTGTLAVSRANTEDWRTVFGYGDLQLRDGLIWDIPLFGIFSPVLNGIVPGLGNSRATAAACTFTLTNGVIHSEDLEIRSSAMRLQYRGTVDLEGRLNARVEAGLLRDVWLVGPLVSTVLWPVTKMFEYKVAGTLDDPKTEPVFLIPKIVLLPFHPLRTLKGLLPEGPAPPQNPPPANSEAP